MKDSSKYILTVLTLALTAARISPVSAAVANVSVINFAFVPAATNVSVNDQVVWTWQVGANFHNVTSSSDPEAWVASATLNGPATFSNTFTSAGTFPYLCTVHGFTGAITVSAPQVPPTISITSPSPGIVLAAPANLTLQAEATNGSGTLTNVQFLLGASILTNEAAAPFAVVVSNLSPATYTFAAVAFDDDGLSDTNSISINVVSPLPVLLSNAMMLPPAGFQFTYTANNGLSYVIQRSSNLMDWDSLATNRAASNSPVFIDTQATNYLNYYRVGRVANP